MKINKNFYIRNDTIRIANELLGKVLCTKINNNLTKGIIVETEAYLGIEDKGSHAYGGKKTKRTSVMYEEGGVAYVYFCYGMHNLFNVVTNKKGIPHAILIRSIIPIKGENIILKRRGKEKITKNICNGPGKVCQALGINKSHSGISLLGDIIWIEDVGINLSINEINKGKRIGIEYAGKDAFLPYRFWIKEKFLMEIKKYAF